MAAPLLLLLLLSPQPAGAVYVFSVSRISPHPVVQALLTAIVCLTFVGTGVLALRLRPYARFGLLLCAVGFASLISVLHDANGAAAYTVGVLASNLVFAVLVHALLAFPRRQARLEEPAAARRSPPISTCSCCRPSRSSSTR